MLFRDLLLVGLGGMLGSMLRYLAAIIIKPASFPYATFTVNIIGCLLLGIIMGLALKSDSFNNNWRLFLAAGVCGGFTTFSAFSLESYQFIEQGRYLALTSYITLSIVIGLAATFAGIQLTKLA